MTPDCHALWLGRSSWSTSGVTPCQKEPSKLRPAIVIEKDGLFARDFQNAIVMPLTEDARM
jgi:hypothetical protein